MEKITERIVQGLIVEEVFIGDFDHEEQEEAIKLLKELKYVSRHFIPHTWVPFRLDNFVDATQGLAITSYVVGTPLNVEAWEVFTNFARVKNLQMVVVPIRYKNPSSLAEALSQDDNDAFIDPKVYPYLKSERFEHLGVSILADVKAQVTAVDPLNNISSLSRGKPCILPHPTHSLISLPRVQTEDAVIMATTGFISVNTMGDHLAAKKAEFHSITGWAVVSLLESEPLIRLVHCYHNQAYDQGVKYDRDTSKQYPPTASFWGDLHFGQEDRDALNWAIDVTEEHDCPSVVLNDTFDGSTINHHEVSLRKYNKFPSVHKEVQYHNGQIKLLEERFKISIMQSNHNEWFKRWITDIHPMKDLHSAADMVIYAKCLLGEQVLHGKIQKSGSKVGKHQLFHGHETCNGGRLSHKSLSKTGCKSAFGHTHNPLQYQGVANPGCLCLITQDYTEGSLTSWAHGVLMLYDNGVVQLLIKR